MTNRYTALESWAYDRYIAPSVTNMAHSMTRYFPTTLGSETQIANVLDVGCGGGQNAIFVADRYKHVHVTGVDLSSEQIARARARTKARPHRFSWHQGSALALEFGDDRFDQVFSIASIKHWPDPARGVAEMVRITKPGGQIFVVEADRGCRYEDAAAFVRTWSIPRLLYPMALAGFRTWVAGRSLSMDEAHVLFEGLPVRESTVERIDGTPAFLMRATVT